jgi:hypothetical protein
MVNIGGLMDIKYILNNITVIYMNSGICAIVTGMEHSGTTYMSKLINSHSEISSGITIY